jgi:hypothetical protein
MAGRVKEDSVEFCFDSWGFDASNIEITHFFWERTRRKRQFPRQTGPSGEEVLVSIQGYISSCAALHMQAWP